MGDTSWLIHESPGGKTNWLLDIKLFSVINLKDYLQKITWYQVIN